MKRHIFELREKALRYEGSSQLKPEKLCLNEIRAHEHFDTGAVLFSQLSYETNWKLVIFWVRNTPVEDDEDMKVNI